MKKQELIDAIIGNGSLNEQILFVSNKGILFYPVRLVDNLIIGISEINLGSHRCEKITTIEFKGNELIKHLNSYSSDLDLYFMDIENMHEYVLKCCNFNENDEACIIIDLLD